VLTFSPLAWLKLQMFLHAGDTEVGGFAVSRAGDLLYVEDFITLQQETTCVTVEFDDNAVADFFDQCVDQKLTPARFARIWCHTHPGDSHVFVHKSEIGERSVDITEFADWCDACGADPEETFHLLRRQRGV
jgi:hypothetical protein